LALSWANGEVIGRASCRFLDWGKLLWGIGLFVSYFQGVQIANCGDYPEHYLFGVQKGLAIPRNFPKGFRGQTTQGQL